MAKRAKTKSYRAWLTQASQHDAAEFEAGVARRAYLYGDTLDAEAAARRALRSCPGHYSATVILIGILSQSGRAHEIPRLAREAARLSPKEPALHYVAADAAAKLERWDEARRALDKFDELARRYPGKLTGPRQGMRKQAKQLRRYLGIMSAAQTAKKAAARIVIPAAASPEGGGAGLGGSEAGASARRAGGGGGAEGTAAPARPGESSGAATAGAAALLASGAAAARLGRIDTAPASGTTRTPAAGTAALPGGGDVAAAFPAADAPRLLVRIDAARPASEPALVDLDGAWSDDLDERHILLEAQRITLLSQYDDLLCLPALRGVQRLEYQVETARKILQRLNGRALLSDEVGLGKTIEAGMVIKEYLLRGLVRRVLVLVPPGLVQQWQEEMREKFDLEFELWSEPRRVAAPAAPGGGADTEAAGAGELVIGSIAAARLERNAAAFTEVDWDLVVVDEAHHLRRRGTRSWALVNALRKRYVLLLSATPVHNNLMELYEIVTLVRPGALGTQAEFRRRFVQDKEGRRARDPAGLRGVLAEVMVRNTRSHADVVLPKRFATTLVLDPAPAEAEAYAAAAEYARRLYGRADTRLRTWLAHFLGCAGSGPRALAEIASRRLGDGDPAVAVGHDPAAEPPRLVAPAAAHGIVQPLFPGWEEGGGAPADAPVTAAAPRAEMELLQRILRAAARAGDSSKTRRLLELLERSEEQMIVFCRHRATVAELAERLADEGVPHAVYHGSLSRSDKDTAIERFRSGARVLLSTESGGEGRNIQFCRTIINFDLPWDPMLIEQRTGRVHRIGQTRDVFIFNLVIAGTVEEEILRLLEEKIHMFELIVGEVDSILGNLDRREDFAGIILDLWAGARDEADRSARFEAFGAELAASRSDYLRQKELDEALFADDLEV